MKSGSNTWWERVQGQEETLAEHRTSGKAKPIRCSKRVYDAMVGVLAAAERALSVEDIASAVEKNLGDRPADFQVRVPLRLWMHVDPSPITRSRARYHVADPDTFKNTAVSLWNSLRA